MTHINANVPVVDNLLSRFRFTSYNSIVEARIVLAQALRLSMQHPQAYTIAMEQQLPPQMGVDVVAQYVHPWNVACALVNVCLNGPRFGGAELAPQEDLLLHVDAWRPVGSLSFPSAVVPAGEPAPITASSEAQLPLPTLSPTLPPTLPPDAGVDPQGQQAAQESPSQAPAADPDPTPTPAADAPQGALPSPDVRAERRGQSGRPQKSPFEKKIDERNKVAPPPFWWAHLSVSAPSLFTKSPAAALDDSSTGAGPVQSYMVLVALQRRVLDQVADNVTVGELKQFLSSIDGQVARLEHSAAANQLRKTLVPPGNR